MWKIIRQIARNGIRTEAPPAFDENERAQAQAIGRELLEILGQALAIRMVDAGSCNGCELEIHALTNPYYNIEALGIKFVASPRHADLLLVTGPVSRHMEEALKRTYDATPSPKLVIAVGACAISGGLFAHNDTIERGFLQRVKPTLYVPGCPPHPLTFVCGVLDLLGIAS